MRPAVTRIVQLFPLHDSRRGRRVWFPLTRP
jgi:hypothetical protein